MTPITIQVVNVDDITSDEFIKRLAKQVAAELRAQDESESEEFLTDREVAKILRCSVTTVWRKKEKGLIKSVQVGGIRRVRKCDLLGVEK